MKKEVEKAIFYQVASKCVGSHWTKKAHLLYTTEGKGIKGKKSLRCRTSKSKRWKKEKRCRRKKSRARKCFFLETDVYGGSALLPKKSVMGTCAYVRYVYLIHEKKREARVNIPRVCILVSTKPYQTEACSPIWLSWARA